MKLQLMVPLAAAMFVSAATAQEVEDDQLPSVPVVEAAPVEADVQPARQPSIQRPAPPVQLYSSDTPSSNVRRVATKMSAAELRQARALYRSQQRIQRLEMYQWLGYEPLRPNWASIPSMTSRYQDRTIYVPVYIYNR